MAKGGKEQKPKSLDDIAAELGYSPAEFQIRRMVEHRAKIDEWRDHIRVGRIPPDFDGNLQQVQALLTVFQRELAAEERELMPYFFAKKKAIESDVNIKGGLDVNIRKFVQPIED